MVVLQDPEGLVFWPEWEIASWVPEYNNRWRAVRFNGEVAHRPTPPPPGPWVPAGHGLVLPHLLRKVEGGWQDPAGFCFPDEPLAAVPLPGPAPKLEGFPFTREQLIMVTARPKSDTVWLTDEGEHISPPLSEPELLRIYAELSKISGYRWLNHRKLRRVMSVAWRRIFQIEGGQTFSEIPHERMPVQLGLPNLSHLEPRCPALYNQAGLRDWPIELALAPKEFLKANFQSPRRLIANVVWQAWRYRMAGEPREYGTTHRDFWYEPLVYVLSRAGMLEPKRGSTAKDDATWGVRSKLYQLYQSILKECVHNGFFTLAEFGFEDYHPELRHIGDRQANVLIVAEKASLRNTLARLADDFGVSTLLLSGQPSLLGTEYLARELRGLGPIRILALVDYDPGGFMIAESIVEQLLHFGIEVVGRAELVLKPDLITDGQFELLTIPCPQNTAREKTLVKNWLAKGGGIHGQPLGLHVNHFKPYERVRKRIAEMLG